MKPKTLILLTVAGGCGLVAMLGVQQAMSAGNKGPAPIKTARVLVALETIDTGKVLSPSNVIFKAMPVDSLPEDAITKEEDYLERAPKMPLMAGDIIRTSKLGEPGEHGVAMSIPKGMRVITIAVNDTHTASGLLSPGDRVDVLVTYQSGSGRASTTKTKTLLEYVEVFATDNLTEDQLNDGNDSKRAKNVSLLLFPEQVAYVRLAERKGTLSLSWRHRLDDEVVQTRDIDTDLFDELSSGATADRPMYDEFVDYEEGAGRELADDASPSQFLDSVETNQESDGRQPVATKPVEPQKPMWTMQVYSGNNPMVQQFEIQEAATPSASQNSGSMFDMMRSMWGGGEQTKQPERSSVQPKSTSASMIVN